MLLFNLWLALLGAFPLLVQAMWKMPCPGTVVSERLDPVIQPGVVSGHLHRVVGGSGINFTMDPSLTHLAGCSSCTVKQDKSNYYVPQLFFARNTSNGARYEIAPDGPVNIIYDQIRGTGLQAYEKVHAFPEGLTMTAGNPWRRNMTGDAMSHAITFRCPEYPQRGEMHSLPQDCISVTTSIYFPSCWNGRDNTAEDFFSHMSYPDISYNEGNCPASHPFRLVSLKYEFNFDTSVNMYGDGFSQTPWVFAQGDPTGYGLHGVFINGWECNALQTAIDTCTDKTGDIASTCHALTEYTTSECEDCKVPSRVDEPITDVEYLPGCNEITTTYSPPAGSMWRRHCVATDKISDFEVKFENLTERGWAYEGCANSSSPLGMPMSPDLEWESEHMTPHACVAHCDSAALGNATMWASVSGSVCRCSLHSHSVSPVPGFLGQCDLRCPSRNGDLICGGVNHASMYRKCTGDKDSCTNTEFQQFPCNDTSSPATTKRSVDKGKPAIAGFKQYKDLVSIRAESPIQNSLSFIGYKVCSRVAFDTTIDPDSAPEDLSCHVFSGYRAEAVARAFMEWAQDAYKLGIKANLTSPADVVDARIAARMMELANRRNYFFKIDAFIIVLMLMVSIIGTVLMFWMSYFSGKAAAATQLAMHSATDVEIVQRMLSMDPELRNLLISKTICESQTMEMRKFEEAQNANSAI